MSPKYQGSYDDASEPAYMGARKIVGLAGTSHKARQGTGQQLSWGPRGLGSPTSIIGVRYEARFSISELVKNYLARKLSRARRPQRIALYITRILGKI